MLRASTLPRRSALLAVIIPVATLLAAAGATVPGTGGAPLESGDFSWTLVMVASVIGSLGAIVLGLGARMSTATVYSRRGDSVDPED